MEACVVLAGSIGVRVIPADLPEIKRLALMGHISSSSYPPSQSEYWFLWCLHNRLIHDDPAVITKNM